MKASAEHAEETSVSHLLGASPDAIAATWKLGGGKVGWANNVDTEWQAVVLGEGEDWEDHQDAVFERAAAKMVKEAQRGRSDGGTCWAWGGSGGLGRHVCPVCVRARVCVWGRRPRPADAGGWPVCVCVCGAPDGAPACARCDAL